MSGRRQAPSVPFYYPDWLVLRELSRDVADALAKHARGRVLDVGCGDKPYAALAPAGCEWIGVDADGSSNADVRGRADALPFDAASFDTVLCTQVIEHVPDPLKVLEECARVLRPGGALIVSAPQYWELHEEPHDYFRFTPHGLRYMLESCGLHVKGLKREGTGVKVAAQAFNLVVQQWGKRNGPGRSIVVRAAKVPLYACVNIVALCAETIFRSETDALNLFAVALK